MRGRTLATALGAYLAFFAVFLLFQNRLPWLILLGVLVAALLLFRFFRARDSSLGRRIFAAALTVVFAGGALLYAAVFEARKLKLPETYADGESYPATGVVREILYEKPYGSAYVVALSRIGDTALSAKVTLSLPTLGDFSAWDEISFSAVFSENDETYDLYSKSRGIVMAASAEDAVCTAHRSGGILGVAASVSDRLAAYLQKTIGVASSEENASLAEALFLGRRDALAPSLRLAFRRIGVSHLLAVSGLHLSVIIGALELFLRKLTVPRRKKDLLLIAATAAFALLCGLSSSILRASIMLTVFYLADLVGEQNDSRTSLFFSVFLILLFRPYSVFDAGLWLSFSATFGILLLPSSEAKKTKRRGGAIGAYFVSLLRMSLTATVFTLPISWLLYGGISILSPISNLLLLPLVQLLLILLLLLFAVCWVPYLPMLLGKLCGLLLSGIISISRASSELPSIYLSLNYPFVPYCLLALAAGLLLAFFLPKRTEKRVAAILLAVALSFSVCLAVWNAETKEEVRISVFSDGKSDVISLLHDGKTVLVDVSTGGQTVPRLAVDSLSDEAVTEVDFFVLTHYHTYHLGTLQKLVGTIRIRELLLPEAQTDEERESAEALCAALADECRISFYKRDGTATLSCGRMTISLPENAVLSRSSHPLISFFVSAEGYDAPIFAYVGTSGFEDPSICEKTAAARCVFVGTHGPVTKNIYSPSVFSAAEAVIFYDEAERFWTEDVCSDRIRLLSQSGGRLTICAKPN